MNIYGQDLIYNGTALSSLDTDFLLASLGDDTSDAMYERSISGGAITNDNYIKHYYGHIADDVLEFDVTITRCSGRLTKADAKMLTDWFFAYSEPKVLEVVPRDGDFGVHENVEFIGAFVSMNYDGEHDMITFHFENISAYAFTKVQTYTIDTSETLSYTITNIGSKTGEIVYPKITVTPAESGVLRITMGGTTTFSVQMTDNTPFIIDDRNMYLQDGSLYSFDNINNFNWPYLKDGENVWTFSGNAALTVETRYLVTTGF